MKLLLALTVITFAYSFANADCTAPWGGFVSEGSSVQAYYDNYPPAGERCRSEWRYCNNGYLSGYYQYQSCREDMGCQTTEFGYIPNFGSIRAYEQPYASQGERCKSEIRYCNNGYLSGRFRYTSCLEQ